MGCRTRRPSRRAWPRRRRIGHGQTEPSSPGPAKKLDTAIAWAPGKGRTGVVAALVQTLSGASEAKVRTDFVRADAEPGLPVAQPSWRLRGVALLTAKLVLRSTISQ
ncbi:tyrosine-protein phosphatase [Streptomyces sp. NPDC014685]|uniref:tyrosine-protein phosphatase n=1 Tax=Streptomyces sp. NPDC014685 TaxID=3364881 RepID=UPI0036F99D68